MDMTEVVSQMGILVFVMIVGFVCAKLGVTNSDSNKHLSNIVMNVLLVCTILRDEHGDGDGPRGPGLCAA